MRTTSLSFASALTSIFVASLLALPACSGETGGTGGGGAGGSGGDGSGGVAENPCGNGVKDFDQTDIDCGGSCGPCENGKACAAPADCQNGSCIGGLCVLPGCDNGVIDGNETDVDCGGKCDDTRPVCTECDRCAEGKACAVAGDCASGVCTAGKCAAM